MNQPGFVILLFAALLLIVSSVTVKVTAQGNGSSSEKPAAAANGSCSPELFKEKPGLCAVIHALSHNKGSAASSEKPAETGTIISSSPIEVKKLPTMEEKKASAGECPSGQAKDWAGICYPLKECKASISAQPGTCTQSEEEKTTGMLTGALEIKKPAKPLPPSPYSCKSPWGAYATGAMSGAEAAKLNQNYDVGAICASFDF
jgi:hypothetical protein